MDFNLEQVIQQITVSGFFHRLKNIVENIDGWHDHETVFDHSVSTSQRAKDLKGGDFIANSDAKNKFLEWLNEDVDGVKKKDIVVLSGLVHDVGKLLSLSDNEKIYPMNIIKPLSQDQTMCPGHEYWGGIAVKEILKEINISQNVKNFINETVDVHGEFNSLWYFESMKDWEVDDVVFDVKSRARGLYKEAMFNSLIDCFNAKPFEKAKQRIIEIFNSPNLYTSRTYFIKE